MDTEIKDPLPEAEVITETQVESKIEVKEEPKAFDPAAISPETKSYFEKQYEGYSKYKDLASEYDNILRMKEFQDFFSNLRNPKPKEPDKFELTNEQFTDALSDPNKFMQLVNTLAERKASEKFGPEIQNTKFKLETSERMNQLNETVKRHPDFMELDKRNLVEPYLRKYPGIDFEDAYKLAKSHVMNEEIDKKARGLVDEKKSSATERPSNSNGGRGSRIRVKNNEEAMIAAWEAVKNGKPEPEFEYTEQ